MILKEESQLLQNIKLGHPLSGIPALWRGKISQGDVPEKAG